MTIIELLFTIAIAGFLVFLLMQIPMPQVFKNIMLGVVVFALILWILKSFGLIHSATFLKLK